MKEIPKERYTYLKDSKQVEELEELHSEQVRECVPKGMVRRKKRPEKIKTELI
jgi:hypothetical protein